MLKRNLVIQNNSICSWRPKKIKTNIKQGTRVAGFFNPVVGTVVFAVFSGLFYLYSINQSAIKGFQIRQIEKEMYQMKDENEALKIKEAQLKSLYNIEQNSQDLNMVEVAQVKYLDDSNSFALNSSSKILPEFKN